MNFLNRSWSKDVQLECEGIFPQAGTHGLLKEQFYWLKMTLYAIFNRLQMIPCLNGMIELSMQQFNRERKGNWKEMLKTKKYYGKYIQVVEISGAVRNIYNRYYYTYLLLWMDYRIGIICISSTSCHMMHHVRSDHSSWMGIEPVSFLYGMTWSAA